MSDFKQVQMSFAQHIKDPDNSPCPEGIEPRRMAVYQDLFFNNIMGFVSNGFPVLYSLYDDACWQKLVRGFFVNHPCASPIFLDIANEFITYLSSSYVMSDDDPLFMLELAHYEWVELVISIRQQSGNEPCLAATDIESATLCLSALAWPLSYQFPVHQLAVDYQPEQEPDEATHLVVYRNDKDDVEFTLLNSASVQLLALIQQNPGVLFSDLMSHFYQLMPQVDKQILLSGMQETLAGFAKRGIVRRFKEG